MRLAIDLFCGLGGWTDGLLAEGYYVVGFDNERHEYGEHRYPGSLVIQDVLTLHGRQFKDATLIVASPPCTEYSYMAMPWRRAKRIAAALRGQGDSSPLLMENGQIVEFDTDGFPIGYTGSRTIDELNRLFDACFRLQREACEAAGRHVPLVVENVVGAQAWVGPAQTHFGSYYLWGDVPMCWRWKGIKHGGGGLFEEAEESGHKNPGFRFDGSGKSFQSEGVKNAGQDWSAVKVPSAEGRRTDPGKGARFTSRDCGQEGIKQGGDWFNAEQPSLSRLYGSKSPGRKAASALIAKIPLSLSRAR